jgi:hypothetical protein
MCTTKVFSFFLHNKDPTVKNIENKLIRKRMNHINSGYGLLGNGLRDFFLKV